MTSNKRHHGDKEKEQFNITTGYILCFIAHIIPQGAHFEADNPPTVRLYRKGRYGINIPHLCNITTRDAFTFMRRYIYFCNNKDR